MMSRQILVASAGVVCLVLSAFSLAANSAQATTINVDFNATNGSSRTYSGAAMAPGGTSWNGVNIGNIGAAVTTFTSAALTASDGVTPTSVTVTLGNYGTYDTQSYHASVAPALLDDYAYDIHSITTDHPPTGVSPVTFSIDHLTPNGYYDLYVYSQNGFFDNIADNFTVDGVTKAIANTGSDSTFGLGANYQLFSTVLAIGGTISGDFVDTEFGNLGVFNGFQLVTTTPEPASFVLFAFGVAGLFAYRIRGMRAQRAIGAACLSAVCLASLPAASSAQAGSINVDIKYAADFLPAYSGVGEAPDSGTFWNYAPNGVPTPSTIKESDGVTTTTATLSMSGQDGFSYYPYAVPSIATSLYFDYAYTSATSAGHATFTIGGLTVGGDYDVYLYSMNSGAHNGATTTFNVGGVNMTADSTDAGVLTSFVQNGNYVEYTGVIAAGGTITGSYFEGVTSTTDGSFNGFQLVAVPEPASFVLFALGIAGLLAYRIRGKRALKA